MKKYMLAFLFCLSCNTIDNSVCANYVINPGSATTAIKAFMNLKVSEFIRLSPGDYSALTGKKMTLTERVSFSLLKIKMKRALRKNPEMKASEFIAQNKKLSTGWIIVIVLGALLIIAAILIAIAASATADAAASLATSAANSGSCGFGAAG